MITVIHQPDFMPWMGYFDKIQNSNLLIYLDDVQFSRRGWTHRDKIRNHNNHTWLTVPIEKKNNYFQKIKDTKIKDYSSLGKFHLDKIKNAYKKSINFEDLYLELEKIYNRNHKYLIDINLDLIDLFFNFLKIKKKTSFSSNLNLNSNSSERLIEILKINKSNKYLTGEPSKNYIDLNLFKQKKIEIIWHKFNEKEYMKQYNEFNKNLSTLDFLMNKK